MSTVSPRLYFCLQGNFTVTAEEGRREGTQSTMVKQEGTEVNRLVFVDVVQILVSTPFWTYTSFEGGTGPPEYV